MPRGIYEGNRLSLDDIKANVAEKNSNLVVESVQFNAEATSFSKRYSVTYSCKVCNKSKTVQYSTLTKSGCKCGFCVQKQNGVKAANTRRLEFDSVKSRINQLGNGEYTLISETYENVHTDLVVRHNICGNDYTVTFNNFRQGTRCPVCRNRSRGEMFVELALKDLAIKFEREWRPDNLRYKRPLSFDFLIPNLNIVIEYDGEQHVNENNSWHDDEVVIRDNLKTEYCKEHGLELIRIPHTIRTFEAIKNVLQTKLGSTTIES